MNTIPFCTRVKADTVRMMAGLVYKVLALAACFIWSASAEVIKLGTICKGTGIDIVYPDRSDIVSLEITFLKPGTGVTNLVTLVTTNRLLQLADIPAELPDGRTILAMRWITLGGIKSQYRMATLDLYRELPEPPIVRPTFVSLTIQTNDAPVRTWHGAMTPPTNKQFLSVDPELARAVADQFRKPTDLPPPLPPATNGMQRAYEETPAQRAQRMFFEQGGAKGERPTIIPPGRIIWK